MHDFIVPNSSCHNVPHWWLCFYFFSVELIVFQRHACLLGFECCAITFCFVPRNDVPKKFLSLIGETCIIWYDELCKCRSASLALRMHTVFCELAKLCVLPRQMLWSQECKSAYCVCLLGQGHLYIMHCLPERVCSGTWFAAGQHPSCSYGKHRILSKCVSVTWRMLCIPPPNSSEIPPLQQSVHRKYQLVLRSSTFGHILSRAAIFLLNLRRRD